jgi:hypothetical protein
MTRAGDSVATRIGASPLSGRMMVRVAKWAPCSRTGLIAIREEDVVAAFGLAASSD